MSSDFPTRINTNQTVLAHSRDKRARVLKFQADLRLRFSHKCLLLAHLSPRLIGELIV